MNPNHFGPDQEAKPYSFGDDTFSDVDFFPDHVALLKARDPWLCPQNRYTDKGKKPRKVPVASANPGSPGINATDPSNWLPHEEAKTHHEDNPFLDHYGLTTYEVDP